ncbi:MAG: ABC transporter permease [Bryobacteraceae bacterium]
MLRDLTLAFRRLRNSPSFTLVALLTLGLGIGANTVVFTVINSVLLRPLPVADPATLFSVHPDRGRGPSHSYPAYRDLRDRNQVLSGLAAVRIAPVHMSRGTANSRIWGYLASGNYFEVLGVKPAVGRFFGPADDVTRGGHAVAVLSYGCWQRLFAGDPAVAGRGAKINGLDYTILGVAPAGFFGTEVLINPDVWIPMAMQPRIEPGNDWLDDRSTHNAWLVGRLRPGVTKAQAESGLDAVAVEMAREHPGKYDELRFRLVPPGLLGSTLRGPVAGGSAALFALAGLVLLLACVNLAGLLLARALARRREIAVCLAIGANRSRLMRQLLTESLLLASAAAAVALLFTWWLAGAFSAWRLPFDALIRSEISPDGSVLWVGFSAALVTTVLFGLLPAFQATRISLAEAMKGESGGSTGSSRLRDLLTAGQVAISVVLLVATVLEVRSLRASLELPLGFEPQGVVSVSFNAALQGLDQAGIEQLRARLLEKARALPGAVAVAMANDLPLSIGTSTTGVRIEGKPEPPPSQRPLAMYYFASPGYFATMRTRLIEGREFTERDRTGAPPVVLVNQEFARRYLDGASPLGKRVRFRGMWSEVVGVAENGKYGTLGDDLEPVIWASMSQHAATETSVVLRSRLPAEQAMDQLRRLVAEQDPSLPLYQEGPLAGQLSVHLFRLRGVAGFLGAMGALAMALAATGIYGGLSFAVARRRREIGIRVALGAVPAQVASLVVGRSMALVTAGALAGLALAAVASRWMSPLLAGVGPHDPVSFAVAFAAILVAGVLAAWRPARAAATVDPIQALRQD